MSRVLFCLITNQIKTWVNHSGQIQARNDDTITKILYLIYTVWHLATPFLVFFSFLDSTISGHVTQISDFLRYRKIKVTDFSEVAKFWKVLINFHKVMIIINKILCKFALGHALINMLEMIHVSWPAVHYYNKYSTCARNEPRHLDSKRCWRFFATSTER